MRVSEISRKTSETEVSVKVNLDGEGEFEINTGTAFCDHMIASLATHSLIDMEVRATGDLKHHVVEDVAICLGEALRKALGDGKRINRFGYAIVPMERSLAFSAIDLAKRPSANIELKLEGNDIEDMPCEDIYHFLHTLALSFQVNLHLWIQCGANDHHQVEAAIKAFALSLKQGVAIDVRRKGAPSSKGAI